MPKNSENTAFLRTLSSSTGTMYSLIQTANSSVGANFVTFAGYAHFEFTVLAFNLKLGICSFTRIFI